MDTLAFWLPLLLLFVSALMGTALKRRTRDHCLKKFEGSKIILPTSTGKWESGRLKVFAQGIELTFSEAKKEPCGSVNSLVLHPNEVGQSPYFLRPAPPPDTRLGVTWERELQRIRRPSMTDRGWRAALNFYNMLRDAFGQAAQAILGAITKDSSFSKVKNSDKRMSEMQAGLTELVPNAWEPVLEKYRGHPIVVERKTSTGLIKESGILEDYSSKYLLVREVEVREPELLKFLEDNPKLGTKHDLVYSRGTSMIRHTLSEPSQSLTPA